MGGCGSKPKPKPKPTPAARDRDPDPAPTRERPAADAEVKTASAESGKEAQQRSSPSKPTPATAAPAPAATKAADEAQLSTIQMAARARKPLRRTNSYIAMIEELDEETAAEVCEREGVSSGDGGLGSMKEALRAHVDSTERLVTRIQAVFRGYLVRRQGLIMSDEDVIRDVTATALQAAARGWLARRLVGEHVKELEDEAAARKKRARRNMFLKTQKGGGCELEFFMKQGGSPKKTPAPSSGSPAQSRIRRVEQPTLRGGAARVQGVEVDTLSRGIDVLLYREDSAESRFGQLWLATDLSMFYWKPEGGAASELNSVSMDSIKSIVFGPCTESFRRRGNLLAAEPWQCFSLITRSKTVDFAAVHDRDARTVIVGIQLIKCAGNRTYIRKGILLWQTARMRLKRESILNGSSMQSSLLKLLQGSHREMIEDTKRQRRANFLRHHGGAEMIMASPTARKGPETLEKADSPDSAAAAGPPLATMAGKTAKIEDPEVQCLLDGLHVMMYENGRSATLLGSMWLSADRKRFFWKAVSESKGYMVLLDAIKSVVFGPCTYTFRQRGSGLASEPWQCFSLITAERTIDFATLADRDARNAIVGVQLIKCRGERKYIKKGILLWQTARMRLKRDAITNRCDMSRSLARLVRRASKSLLEEEESGGEKQPELAVKSGLRGTAETRAIKELLAPGVRVIRLNDPDDIGFESNLRLSGGLRGEPWMLRCDDEVLANVDDLSGLVFGPMPKAYRDQMGMDAVDASSSMIGPSKPWASFSIIVGKRVTEFECVSGSRGARSTFLSLQHIKGVKPHQRLRLGRLLWQVARMHLNSEALNEQAGMMKTLTRVLVRTQSDKYLGF